MVALTEEIIDLDRLQRFVGPVIFERGRLYFTQRRVEIDYVEDDYASCTVTGKGGVYDVRIEFDRGSLFFYCDCPYATDGKICKHIIASCIAVRDYLHSHRPVRWQTVLTKVLESSQERAYVETITPFLLFFKLEFALGNQPYSTWQVVPYQIMVNSISAQWRAEVQADPTYPDLIERLLAAGVQSRSASGAIDYRGCLNGDAQAVTAANLLVNQSRLYYLPVPLASTLTLLSAIDIPLFYGRSQDKNLQRIEFIRQHGRFRIEVNRTVAGVRLAAGLDAGGRVFALQKEKAQILTSSPFWVLAGQYLVQVEGDNITSILAIFEDTPELVIPREEEQEFLEKYYLPLAKGADLSGDAVQWETVKAEPSKRLYIDDDKGTLRVQLCFGYGDHEVPYDQGLPVETLQGHPGEWKLTRIHRRQEFEGEAFRALNSQEFGLKRSPTPTTAGEFLLRARIHPVDFLMKNVPLLVRAGYDIYGEENLKNARVNRSRPTISFHVSSGIDWFDVHAEIHFGDIEVSLKELRKALRKKERYIKLADGTIGEIPTEWVDRYRHLFALGEDTSEGLRLSNHHLTMMDQLLSEADLARTDEEFQRRLQRLKDFASISEQSLPQGFAGELRPYQKFGYDWLHFLHEFGFGGCLADDMGLGKTIQVLAFLLSLRDGQHSNKADLIVLPRSLLVNWQREAARFTPGLKVMDYFGNLRDKDTSIFDQYDLVMTTYGVMLRDVELLREYNFHYVVLDESQIIKNPVAQTAKAARLLKSDHRLVVTGTPVENSTMELWSQFAFLNPGLLGNLEYFRNEFGTPIEKKGDEKQALFLRRMVYPFILRRTKGQVAPDLPPRTERVIYTDMEPAQRKMYNRTRDYYRGLLMGMLDNGGMNDARMKILEGLLRLRQICIHPRLVERHFHGESSKFDLLIDNLETLQAEGHKVLVFSQFVEMLRLVRSELDSRHMHYVYLDGQTRDRQGIVDIFQNDSSISFFLISLKAGGLGLNLTAADYVILIDPWWNPAVETQAADRTHRIGQEKPVFVYKFVVRDSVEEKILQLQDKKKELVDQLISTESGFLKSLTSEDVQVLFS